VSVYDLPPLEHWTFQTVLGLVRAHEFEPGQFDYKSVLTGSGPQRDEVLASIQRTACSLANTDGGYILFGIKDRREQVGSPDERIVGLSVGPDLRKQFGDKVHHIQPELHFDAVPQAVLLPSDSRRGVFVVRMQLSPLRPHRAPDGIFYRRGDGGTAIAMSYYEVRDQMLLTDERLRKVNLLRLDVALLRHVSDLIRRRPPPQRAILSSLRFDTSGFKSLVADVVAILPDESPLLETLLTIPIQASVANQHLDTANDPSALVLSTRAQFLDALENDLLSALSALDQLCISVEERLTEAFGPLPFSRGRTTNVR
jgi:hypothetical protein